LFKRKTEVVDDSTKVICASNLLKVALEVQLCATLYIPYVDNLLKGFESRFKEPDRMKFIVPFITNPLLERDKNESAELILCSRKM
jgi:hypothetical protein